MLKSTGVSETTVAWIHQYIHKESARDGKPWRKNLQSVICDALTVMANLGVERNQRRSFQMEGHRTLAAAPERNTPPNSSDRFKFVKQNKQNRTLTMPSWVFAAKHYEMRGLIKSRSANFRNMHLMNFE